MRKKSNGANRAEQRPTQSATVRNISRGHDRSSSEEQPRAGAALQAVARGSRSLMKTSDLGVQGAAGARTPGKPLPVSPRVRSGKPSASPDQTGRKHKIEERIAAATEELVAGITEAASAAEQLRRSMEQIGSGAEEAASASQETLAVATNTAGTLVQARERADGSRRRIEALQGLLAESSVQIGAWAVNIKRNGERQAASVAVIEQLSQQAIQIADVTKTVSQVSDQTNLLALNAAIEAARAGDHGRGFAVVADEVRALAETSEQSAREAQALATQIQEHVTSVAAAIKAAADAAVSEVEKGQTVILALEDLRKEAVALTQGSQAIAMEALEAEVASREAQRGAEIISSAAEEQAAASAEALRSIEQQSTALDQSQSAAQSLSAMTGNLRAALKGTASVDQLASAAEQLSTAVQEISGASQQIMSAAEQISKGAQQQASATQEASAALGQIAKTARVATENASKGLDSGKRMVGMLGEVRVTVADLSAGVARSFAATRGSLALIAGIEVITRSIEKIVDGIGIVSVQINMLAVNGSIEAARAGEFGKGFAVVSKDIRNLARDSGVNAGRIKDTVRAIQDQVAEVRHDLEQVIAAVEAENQRNAAVLTSLGGVESDMIVVSADNQEIMNSARALLTSVGEAALGAQQVASVAEEAGSAAAQAAAAAKQQARGAEDLAAAIEEIASLAEDIKRRDG
jgi:methyl-accepting chemotaxis protein